MPVNKLFGKLFVRYLIPIWFQSHGLALAKSTDPVIIKDESNCVTWCCKSRYLYFPYLMHFLKNIS